MRDIHGRYTNIKDLSEIAPDWSHGCADCKFGIVLAPDIVGAVPLYEGRAVQAREEMILFCNCRAGHMYRQYLRKVYNGLTLASVRIVLEHIAAMSTPTVHGVSE